MQTLLSGTVSPGFQFASGEAARRSDGTCPFPDGTLKLQDPYFRDMGIEFSALVPGLHWGTINVKLDDELVLGRADFTAEMVDWTAALRGPARIGPESFSFVRCCFVYAAPEDAARSAYYPGLLYYPHPETKPSTNAHDYRALEVLTSSVPNLRYGTPASILCRADAFLPRQVFAK